MAEIDGEDLDSVSALTALAVLEDYYNQHAGATYNPSGVGERGWQKKSDAELDDGVNVIVHRLHTPLEVDTAIENATPFGPAMAAPSGGPVAASAPPQLEGAPGKLFDPALEVDSGAND